MAAIDSRIQRQRGFALPLALRFFLATAILIALAVGAAIVVTYAQGKRAATAAVDRSLATSAAVQREFEQSRLEQLQLSLQVVAADASFVNYISNATSANNLPGLGGDAAPDTGSMRDLLNDRQKEFGFDLGILLDGRGEVLARTDQAEAFRDSLADDNLVAAALKDSTPKSGYWRLNNRLYQAAIVPLAQDQRLVGFLLLALTVDDALSKKVAQVSGAQIAFWLPVGEREELVASSLEAKAAEALKSARSDGGMEWSVLLAKGTPADAVKTRLDGQEWVAKLAPTAAADARELGTVMVLTSADQILSSYQSILNSVVIAGLISMLAALLLSFVISKGILRPVRAMAKAAEDAAAGNFQTRIGTEGSDELARLARAFDSLLSDLREKSDMEGYVGNLARFLPEPGQDAAPVVELRTRPSSTVREPRRESFTLLGLEFRDLLTLPADMAPDLAVATRAHVVTQVQNTTSQHNSIMRNNGGARWLLAFSGENRLSEALRSVRGLFAMRDAAGAALPAVALADGILVLSDDGDGPQLLGATQVQVDRLMCEAAPGQILAARNVGESLKQAFGESVVAPAVGGYSGKQYYSVLTGVFEQLPAMPVGSTATVVSPAAGSPVAISRAPRTGGGLALDARGELAAGSVLGERYRVLSILGAGGMGVVYKAHDLELDDVVALKMLKPGALLDAEQLDRLKSEIKLARRITHPNVLRTFDFGEVNGLPYISMEYVRGLTLRYLLREAKRVPYSAGLRIARQLAAGLVAAHEVGVLHRDIKPENLILEANGNAKLMDFGIARPVRRAEPGHTQPGTFLGTPNYCAPEQLAGEEVDERADIYSCGVLMTEMFCGALPYTGNNTMEIYMAQMQQEPARPSALWPEIRPELEAVILRCLHRNRTERMATAAELAAALSQLRA
ncbi:MAG: protein kinase [Tahibacter sp.]